MFYNCAFVCSRLGRQYIVLRKDIIIFFHFAEIAVSVNYGFRVGKIEFCQKHQECQSVCKASEQQYLFSFFLRKILVEEKKVVAEIKVSFAWISLGERCSANMIYGLFCHSADSIAGIEYSAAQVNFFHVGKESGIKTAEPQI